MEMKKIDQNLNAAAKLLPLHPASSDPSAFICVFWTLPAANGWNYRKANDSTEG